MSVMELDMSLGSIVEEGSERITSGYVCGGAC